MQKLTDRHHSPTVDRALRLFIRRARGRPELEAHVASASRIRARLREKREAYIETVDERVALGAELVYLDKRVDRIVLVSIRRDLAAMTAGLSKTEGLKLEKKLFQGVAPSTAMRPVASESQGQYVAGILQRIDDDPDYAGLADHARRLRKEQKAIDEALKRRKEARVREALAQADLEDATEEARRFYNQLYPQAQITFPDDPALVESLFIDLRGAAGEDGGGEEGEGGEGEGGGGEGEGDDVK